MEEIDVVMLPPAYCKADQDARGVLLEQLAALDRQYSRLREPIIKALVDIECRYPPRYLPRLRAEAGEPQ